MERLYGFHEVVRGKFLYWLVAAVISCAAPTLADACMAPEFERHVFLNRLPKNIPEEIEWARVRFTVSAKSYEAGEIVVDVIESTLGGSVKKLRVKPLLVSSCSRIGKTEGAAYVIGLITSDERGDFLVPVETSPYRPEQAFQAR